MGERSEDWSDPQEAWPPWLLRFGMGVVGVESRKIRQWQRISTHRKSGYYLFTHDDFAQAKKVNDETSDQSKGCCHVDDIKSKHSWLHQESYKPDFTFILKL